MSGAKKKPVTFETVRRLALALPGVEEGTSYGTPAFRVRGKLLARLREDGETLVMMVEMGEPEVLIEQDPKVFFTTDHYRGYPAVLMHLAAARAEVIGEMLERAWRRKAGKRALAGFGGGA